nr:KCU-star family selenoprotein [uncultured Campylobacter sp.]
MKKLKFNPLAAPKAVARLLARADAALAPLIGLGDYEGYLRHFRSAHPDEIPLSRAEFFRAMQDSKAKNVKC